MHCVFRDALLHATVVMCGYLRYCHLPVSFNQSGPSLASLINAFLPLELLLTGCFFLFRTILCKLLCMKIPGDQLKPSSLASLYGQSDLNHVSSPF